MCSSLESVCVTYPVCDKTAQQTDVCLLAGSRPAAEFYVFVGVIVMLYCIATLVIYIFFDELYRKNNRFIVGVRNWELLLLLFSFFVHLRNEITPFYNCDL